MKFMLLFVLLFSGCHKISVPARETFYELFPISLPNEVALREFHTNFANENDLMFAVQFRSEQECLIYNTKWGISTGMSGKEQLFQIVKGEIQATDFGDLLIREGWPMSLADYTACEGRIKSGKIAQVFVHREKMLIVLFG